MLIICSRSSFTSNIEIISRFIEKGNRSSFFNTIARRAFGKLTTFALDISPTIAGQSLGFFPPTYAGIAQRFEDYFREDESREAVFLKDAIQLAVNLYGLTMTHLFDFRLII